jgi:hypothetical protein
MAITLDGTNGTTTPDLELATGGSASNPAITVTGDTNTGIFFPAADTIAFGEGGAEVARFNADAQFVAAAGTASLPVLTTTGDLNTGVFYPAADTVAWTTGGSERARITSDGNVLFGMTTADIENPGQFFVNNGTHRYAGLAHNSSTSSAALIYLNRGNSDGDLMVFRQANTTEGTISVSGTTVSYNGGHLSRWAQMLTKPDLLKGTVMSNLDEMNVYTDAEGNPVDNEQLNKVKVSDVEGDINVAGVFVNWTYDDAHQVDEINMAMTGDMIIRIAQGVVVQKGDLLMSAGDGTAKPQGDDIVRSKTVAKVTSNHVTCTYADGSYCVPCVLMAC